MNSYADLDLELEKEFKGRFGYDFKETFKTFELFVLNNPLWSDAKKAKVLGSSAMREQDSTFKCSVLDEYLLAYDGFCQTNKEF